jgi:hypothetical protein
LSPSATGAYPYTLMGICVSKGIFCAFPWTGPYASSCKVIGIANLAVAGATIVSGFGVETFGTEKDALAGRNIRVGIRCSRTTSQPDAVVRVVIAELPVPAFGYTGFVGGICKLFREVEASSDTIP